MTLTADTKDFLLHLYDKLWENMGAKEGRLWNYLSIYGAAVALALGAGGFGGVEMQSVVLVLALTVWAVLIVINANWWYQRNRLMVTQIEKRFAEGGYLDGIIPKEYRDASFQMDRLYEGSVLILCGLAALLYLRSMWLHSSPSTIGDRATAYTLAGIYVIFVLSAMYCTTQHHSYIASFYNTKKTLLLEWDPKSDVGTLPAQEEKAQSRYGWRIYSGFALIYAMVVFDSMPARAALSSLWPALIGILGQIASAVFFYVILGLPPTSKWRRSWWLRGLVFMLILGSASALIHRPAVLVAGQTRGVEDLTSIKSDINQLNDRVRKIETNELDQAKSDLQKQTDRFVTKQDASRTYVTQQQLEDAIRQTTSRAGAGSKRRKLNQ